MTHDLELSSAGFTDIDLNSGDISLIEYVPVSSMRGDVTRERIVLRVTGATMAAVSTTIGNIEKAFALADRKWDTGLGDRVYLEMTPDDYTDAYRSEIVRPKEGQTSGVVEYSQRLLGWQWDNDSIRVTLTFYRRNYWENTTESTLTISNGSGSGTSVNCYNIHGDAAFTDSGTTLSFTADDTLADSADGLGVFAAGDVISVRGTTGNNGVFTIESVEGDGSAMTVNEKEIVNEAASAVEKNIYDIQNYVHIPSTNINGNLPTPAKIKLQCSLVAGDTLTHYWVANNYLSTPASFPHLLEFEDSDTGSDSSDADYSSGGYRQYSIDTTEAKVTGWVLGEEMLTSASGNYFKGMLFTPDADVTDVKWRFKILYSGDTIWEGNQVKFDDTYGTATDWREIDTIQLPPFISETGVAPASITLELWGESTSGSAETLNLDCVALIPLDGWRKVIFKDSVAASAGYYDDGILEKSYSIDGSDNELRNTATEGEYIMLDPNQDNRLYILAHQLSPVNGTPCKQAYYEVTINYRERRRAI